MGHSAVASRLLEYWLAAPGVKPDGDFVDGDGGFEYATAMNHDMSFAHDSSHPSTGRMLYAMADHYLLTGDREWFQKNRARITAAAEWILRQHSEYLRDLPGRQDLDVAGIHPPHMLGDFIPAKSHWGWYFMQDGFSLMGLRRFADALAEFDPEAAQRYRDRNDAYAKDVLRAVEREIARAPVRKVRDGTYRRIIPSQAYLRGSKVLEVRKNHGLFDVEAGALPLAHAVVAAADPRVGEYLDVNEEWHARGQNEDPFWSGFAALVKYSYPDTTHLRRDDVPCFLRYWMVNYAGWVSANGGMGEGGTRKLVGNPADKPATGGDSDLGSVGWFMEGFRNLLVMEDGPVLWLARATPRVWLEQGKKISVTNAPTEFGAVAYEIVSDVDNGKINATVEMPARKPPKEVALRFRHPKAAPIKSVTINGKEWTEFNNDKETITLKGLAGTVSVTARY